MRTSAAQFNAVPPAGMPLPVAFVERLAEKHRDEVLAFLAARPLHTMIMAGWVRANGLVSPLHRGVFYGCRDAAGQLTGVALIGHATMFEARTETALAALARLAQACPDAHMLLGESEQVQSFWAHYAPSGQPLRLFCREQLFTQSLPVVVHEPLPGLRPATLAALDLIVPVHAQMAFAESGVNPLAQDAEGFRRRCSRRIEHGETWVCVEDGRLLFKADIISETPAVIYLEGVWVHPDERGRGYGRRGLSQLSRTLLQRTAAVSLLANETNVGAHAFYRRTGFKLSGRFDTIFLQQTV